MMMDVDEIQNCCCVKNFSCVINFSHCHNRDRCRFLKRLLTGCVYEMSLLYSFVFYYVVFDATIITIPAINPPLTHSLPHPYTPTHPNHPHPTRRDRTPYLYLSLSILTYKSTYSNKTVYATFT